MMEKEEEDSYLEDNIFVMKNKSLEYDVVEVDDEAITVDTERDSGVLSQVSMKFMEVIQSTKEKIFGEDYWIPADQFEVVRFPLDILKLHKPIYPEHQNVSNFALKIVEGSMRSNPAQLIYHVAYSYHDGTIRHSLSIYRTHNFEESLDFFRRCEECRVLLKLLDKKRDIRKYIHDITDQIHQHPLWKMVHIAIVCQRLDVFTEEGLKILPEYGYSKNDLISVACVPEGRYPLMLAIEKNQPTIVNFLLELGANPAICDANGNNALHYASLISTQMLEILLTSDKARSLIDLPNIDGMSPVWLAIRNGNFLILKTLSVTHGASLVSPTGKNALFEALQANKTTKDVLRVILESSPELLTKRDEATGNTCLHVAQYKTPLASLLQMKHEELDLNAKNKSGLAPIHLFTNKGDLGLVMTLASYGCNLNEPVDSSRATALHFAVSNKNLTLTRLLLCLGADPNVRDRQGETPRHHAALIKNVDLLHSLEICNAKRCPSQKTGCLSGCVSDDRRSLALLKTHSSPTVNEEKCKGASSPPINELESRISENRKKHRENSIHEFEHSHIFDEMIERLKTITEEDDGSPKKPYINVLSLDGGGIRGLVLTQILMEVEKILGEPMYKYFDWIAGTSTGALVAASLSRGMSLRQVQWIYLRFKDQIFENWIRPYDSTLLESFMQSEMGSESLLSELKWPRLMFTTTRADTFPVKLELVRNYMLPLSLEENAELGFTDPNEMLLWKALRRSSAAPTYFSWVDSKYIDGGIISNNPTLELLGEIQLWNSINKMRGLKGSVDIGCLLSIGTGVIPSIPIHLESVGNLSIKNAYSSVLSIKNLGAILIDQVTATEGVPVSRSSSWCITQRTPYFRLSAPLFKDIAMDNKDDLDISKMMWDCMEYMHTEREYVEKLCKLIKEVGISQRREHIFNINTPTTVKTKEEVERENSMDTSDDTKSFVVN